jgi:hypothetical protein
VLSEYARTWSNNIPIILNYWFILILNCTLILIFRFASLPMTFRQVTSWYVLPTRDKTPFTLLPPPPYNNLNVCARFDKRSDDSGRVGSI